MGLLRIDEKDAREKLRRIQMLIFDVDGVLTNGSLVYGSDDTEYKQFSVLDGLGFNLARRAGFKTALITARKSPIVERRAQELKLDAYFQGNENKAPAFEHLLDQFDMSAENIAFMGDDLLDLALVRRAGFTAAPANARPEVMDAVDYVTYARGGDGAARELVEFILITLGRWQQIVAEF